MFKYSIKQSGKRNQYDLTDESNSVTLYRHISLASVRRFINLAVILNYEVSIAPSIERKLKNS